MRPATVAEMLSRAARPGRRVAVADSGRRLRLAQFDREVGLLAAALRERGIGRGSRVALTLTGLDALACFFAVLRAGGTAVPIGPASAAATLRRLTQTAAISALICDGEPGQAAAAAPGPGGAATVIAAALAELPDAEPGSARLRGRLTGGHLIWATGRQRGDAPAAADGTLDDAPAAIFCTTGTTGEPRTVLHSHAGLVASVLSLKALHRSYFRGTAPQVAGRMVRLAWLYRGRLRLAAGRQTWCTPMPFHTIAGLQFMMQAVLTGHRLVIPPRFHPRTLAETVARERVNVLALTPTMLAAVLAVRSLPQTDTSSLLVVGLGGAPAPADLIRRGERALGCPVLNGYGSTETAGGILAARIGDDSDGSVGHPFPGTEVLVVDPAGRPLPPGTMGELICRTGSLMTGYGDPPDPAGQATQAPQAGPAPGGPHADGWYRTGDLATIDERGAVHILGRNRDLIIRGGVKIVPARVEKVLARDPAVAQAAVVGVPDPLTGERTVAFVVAAPGAGLHIPAVLQNCRGLLGPHEVPDHVFAVAELPTAESGEVRKVELREMAAGKLRASNAAL
jgi:fatty-acyl-CoA synthase